jgi:ATPase subunit of ABC transporter with duplicated ATPase domains
MKDRTVILVSHHVQLCSPGAAYIVALDNGRVQFQGNRDEFARSGVLRTLVQTELAVAEDEKEEAAIEEAAPMTDIRPEEEPSSETSSTIATTASQAETSVADKKKPARKLIEEEARAVGRIAKEIWVMYFNACGSSYYWAFFGIVFVLAALSPVLENGWLRYVYRGSP